MEKIERKSLTTFEANNFTLNAGEMEQIEGGVLHALVLFTLSVAALAGHAGFTNLAIFSAYVATTASGYQLGSYLNTTPAGQSLTTHWANQIHYAQNAWRIITSANSILSGQATIDFTSGTVVSVRNGAYWDYNLEAGNHDVPD
ncbi:MAG: hypothetical protein WBA74_27135 [Cyclobacteriaceae bacterium]